MTALLITLHILVCIALIIIVLLQGGGKGAEMGATFGAGASSTVFGATGGRSFIAKITSWAAVIFMLTSLTLAYFWGQPGSSSVMPTSVGTAQPAAESAVPALPEQPAAPVENTSTDSEK